MKFTLKLKFEITISAGIAYLLLQLMKLLG